MNHRKTLRAFQRVLLAVTDGEPMNITAAGIEEKGRALHAVIIISAGPAAMSTNQDGARAIAETLDVPAGRTAGLGGLIDDLRAAADTCDARLAEARGQLQ